MRIVKREQVKGGGLWKEGDNDVTMAVGQGSYFG